MTIAPDYTRINEKSWHSWRTQQITMTGGKIATPFFWTGGYWSDADPAKGSPSIMYSKEDILTMYEYECPVTV